MSQFKKNTAGQRVGFTAVATTDGSGVTTGVDLYLTLDGGTRTAAAGTATHKGNGSWDYAYTQAETNADCIVLDIGGTGVVPASITIYTTTKRVSELNDIAATAVVSGGAITTSSGKVSAVATVDAIGTDGITADAMSSAAVAKIEAALMNEGDGQALIDAIVQAIDNADIDSDLIPGLVRDAILNRVLAGNHDTPGTLGKLMQSITEDRMAELDAGNLPAVADAIQAKTDNLPASPAAASDVTSATSTITAAISALPTPGDATEAKQDTILAAIDEIEGGGSGGEVTVNDFTTAALAKFATVNTGETTAAAGSVAKLAQGAGSLTSDQQAQLDAIQAKTSLITAGEINLRSPLIEAGRHLVIVRGDSYETGSGWGAIDWSPDDDDDWPDLSDATAVFSARRADDDELVISQAVTIINPAGPDKTLRLELAAEDTEELAASARLKDHKFDLQVTLAGGKRWTPIIGGGVLRAGGMTIVEDQSRIETT